MKKSKLLFLVLLIPSMVLAMSLPRVLTLNLTGDKNEISFNGTVENGSHAVMCKLYDDKDKELNLLSVAVDENKFEGSFGIDSEGTYTVACANYEGGEIKRDTVEAGKPLLYTVKFNTNGGNNIEDAVVEENTKVKKPTDPTKEGYTFIDWCEDETLTTVFDFNKEVTKNTTLYAKWVEDEAVTFTVEFNTTGGSVVDNAVVEENTTVVKPANPTRDGYTFVDWYEDETLTVLFNFDTKITKNTTLYAKWEEDVSFKEYTVSSKDGVSISFREEEGHEYSLELLDILPLTDEELKAIGATREQYNEVKNAVVAATNKYGEILAFYNIEIYDEDDHSKDSGGFNIRIKLTDEMKKYNTFKIIYVKDDYTIEEPIELKVDGDYLVGTLKHLSTYALVGSTTQTTNSTTNPQTSDNIYMWVSILIVSMLGMILTTLVTVRTKKSK